MLNQLDSENAVAIIEHLRAGDPEGAALIEGEMFQFARFFQARQSRDAGRCSPKCSPSGWRARSRALPNEERGVIFAALTEQVRTVVEAEITEADRCRRAR